MSEKKQCFLKSLHNKNDIALLDNTELCLGRSAETGIKDVECSRNQVSVMANYKTHQVIVRHIGTNPSAAEGKKLQNETHVLSHGEVLEMLYGNYPYKVEFTPNPSLTLENSDKRRLSDLEDVLPIFKRPKNSDVSKDVDLSGFGSSKKKKNSTNDKNVADDLINTTIENIILNFEDKQDSPATDDQWESVDGGTLLIYTSVGVRSSSKIAAYDLDGTLILTKSGRVFPKDKDDWRIAFPPVKQKLKGLIEDGFKVVVFTNQAGVGRGKTIPKDFKQKIENVVKELNIPVQVFVATNTNIHRKPAPGMWRTLKDKKNSDIKINIQKSFFVGDGAGRIVNWAPGKKKDFTCADRLFALNVGLTFSTPEEHFLGQHPAKYSLPEFNPSEIKENQPICDSNMFKSTKEVIILVGYPGSGKSFFAQKYLIPEGYVHVNRDNLGTWQRCVTKMVSALQSNKSVVIDNTNPDIESRNRFIAKAKSMNIPCRCFIMSTSYEHSKHNNKFREFTDKTHVSVGDIVINNYKSRLNPPSLEEGFEAIVNVNFVPKFNDPELKQLYKMFLL